MARSLRGSISLLTVVVIIALGETHAQLHSYDVFGMPRFGWLLVFSALSAVCVYAAGVPGETRDLAEAALRSLVATLVAAGLVSVLALVVGEPLLPRFVVLGAVALLTPLLALANDATNRSERRRASAERVLAVVDDEERLALASDLEHGAERPALLVASIEPGSLAPSRDDPAPLAALVAQHHVTLIVLNREARLDERLVAQVVPLHRKGIRVRTLTLFYDEWLGKLPLAELEQAALLFDINELHQPLYQRLRRVIDVTVAIPGLLVLALAAPVLALADLFANRGPLLYRQHRVGKNGTIFTILKFRTMAPGGSSSEWTAPGDPRVSRLGRALRRTHLDELPQFVNVLRGELAVVGPRPEQPRYVEELAGKIAYYELRHVVRPGMTGWAQVKYRYASSELDAYEKLQYEFFYLRHQSIGLDLRIIGRTLRSIAGRSGR